MADTASDERRADTARHDAPPDSKAGAMPAKQYLNSVSPLPEAAVATTASDKGRVNHPKRPRDLPGIVPASDIRFDVATDIRKPQASAASFRPAPSGQQRLPESLPRALGFFLGQPARHLRHHGFDQPAAGDR